MHKTELFNHVFIAVTYKSRWLYSPNYCCKDVSMQSYYVTLCCSCFIVVFVQCIKPRMLLHLCHCSMIVVKVYADVIFSGSSD